MPFASPSRQCQSSEEILKQWKTHNSVVCVLVCVSVVWWIRAVWTGVPCAAVVICTAAAVAVGRLSRPTKCCVWTRRATYARTTAVADPTWGTTVLGPHTEAEVTADKRWTGTRISSLRALFFFTSTLSGDQKSVRVMSFFDRNGDLSSFSLP